MSTMNSTEEDVATALAQFRLAALSSPADFYANSTVHAFDVAAFNVYWAAVQTLGYFLLVSITQVRNGRTVEFFFQRKSGHYLSQQCMFCMSPL